MSKEQNFDDLNVSNNKTIELEKLIESLENQIYRIEQTDIVIEKCFDEIEKKLINVRPEIGGSQYRSYKSLCFGWNRNCPPGCEMFTALDDIHNLYVDTSNQYIEVINNECDGIEDCLIDMINHYVNKKIYMPIRKALIEALSDKALEIEDLPIEEFECLDYISDEILMPEFVRIKDMHIDVVNNGYLFDVKWDERDLNVYWKNMLTGLDSILKNSKRKMKKIYVSGVNVMILEYIRIQHKNINDYMKLKG